MRLFDMDSREDYLLDGKYKVATPYAPCVDAVEVVRCKDCIHYESDGGAMMVCNVTDMVCDNGDYCSYGERREESEVEE